MPEELNPSQVVDLAEEYLVALKQLRHADKQAEKVLEQVDRDRTMAVKRYKRARARFLGLALEDDEDEYLDDPEKSLDR